MNSQKPHIVGALQAVSVITNSWAQSIRFYTEALGYRIIERGELTHIQKNTFGRHLGKYALLGYDEGSVVRLIETSNIGALPNRIGAHPWDNGLAVMEACTADVERAYWKVLRARFGAIASPGEFDFESFGNQTNSAVKSVAFIGPSGEQLFVTETNDCVERCEGINAPSTAVISVTTHELQSMYAEVLGSVPINDFRIRPLGKTTLLGAPAEAGFEMCLMGYDTHSVGLEQHIYSDYAGDTFQTYPCDFLKTGVASACWQGQDLSMLRYKLQEANWEILSEVGLPIRGNPEPEAVVFQGPVGEILELLA
ncbi:VOC family protein [Runella sp.]|uniref:VOC family protein n=1 Tax=Runella sp. TaxID=1960881 RepID=UPI003D0E9425